MKTKITVLLLIYISLVSLNCSPTPEAHYFTFDYKVKEGKNIWYCNSYTVKEGLISIPEAYWQWDDSPGYVTSRRIDDGPYNIQASTFTIYTGYYKLLDARRR